MKLASYLGLLLVTAHGCTLAAAGEVDPDRVAISVTPAGAQRHVPGRWTTLRVTGKNTTDTDVQQTVVVTFGENKNLQFARRFWIPARARRRVWLPVKIPAEIDRTKQQTPMTTMRIQDRDGFEQFESNSIGQPTIDRSMLVSWDESHAVTLFESQDEAKNNYYELNDLYWATNSARDTAVRSEQDLGISSFNSPFLPSSPKVFDAMDQLVIAGDLILSDSTSVRQLRAWLRSGGRIWIMLDRVDHEFVQRLLGDSVSHSVVDVVELNDFQLREIAAHKSAGTYQSEEWSSERPVKMVRVLTDSADIHCRVNGWPAAFWKDVGQGEVLFTTLGAMGWFRGEDSLRAYDSLMDRFFVNRLRELSDTEHVARSLETDIGYRIPGRTPIATTLGIQLLVLLGSAIYLGRRQALQHMAIVIPVSAIVAAAVLVVSARQRGDAIEPTIATGQIARVSAENAEVQVDSTLAVYSPQGRPLSIQSSAGTTTMLPEDELRGPMKRILWTDDGQSQWMFVNQPPGVVRHISSTSTIPLAKDWIVEGGFDMDGFTGRMNGLSPQQCEDPIIVAPSSPALSVKFPSQSESILTAGADGLLAPQQYINEAFMTDRQRYRQEILRGLITPERPGFGPRPSLLVWTGTIDSGVEFDKGFRRQGWALVSIPIQLKRQPPGTDFRLPATFLPMEAYEGVSNIYRPRTGKWMDEMNRAAEEQLYFKLPLKMIPCQLKRADMVIKINAPSRALEIGGYRDGKYVSLHREQNPIGKLTIPIDRADVLQHDAKGGVRLVLKVSESEESPEQAEIDKGSGSEEANDFMPNRNVWKIQYLYLSLEGTTK